MKKDQWKNRIQDACEAAGTYQPYFDDVILSLAEILEKRDEAQEGYEASGSEPVITHTNRARESNMVKNPYITIWIELNAQALAYWRDLGLTPSGLKKLNETALKVESKGALEQALANIGGA